MDTTWTILRLLTFFLLLHVTFAWKLCSDDEGGGICPDDTTCCPTEIPGESACIPLVHVSTPRNKPKGICCNDATACRFGYECAVSALRSAAVESQGYCRATKQATKYDANARDTPRYETCRIPEDSTRHHGFPLSVSSNLEQRNLSLEEDVFHLAYLSNFGDIASQDSNNETTNTRLDNIEQAIIVIHGSLRDVEDYFCAGLSLVQNDDYEHSNSTLILAPKFATTQDHLPQDDNRYLVWDDHVQADKDYLFHIWRYGADAANAPISSYTALDRMVEHLSNNTRFPNLQQITLVGHSAGGQTLQRWSLLSNSKAWNHLEIRVVVANARSYAYLDGRRWFDLDFRLPTKKETNHCPWYDQWLWGLENGGDLHCPYRDVAMAEVGSPAAVASRFAERDVVYLSGEYDTIPQTNDRCGNAIQGIHRHERALNYYKGLEEYFGKQVHSFFTVPKSNHDHALMFQSPQGRNAIFGRSSSVSSSSTQEPEVVDMAWE